MCDPTYRWRLEASCLGALPTSPGSAGGYAQAFLAAPYMVLRCAPGSTLSICCSRRSGRYIPRLLAVAASGGLVTGIVGRRGLHDQ